MVELNCFVLLLFFFFAVSLSFFAFIFTEKVKVPQTVMNRG